MNVLEENKHINVNQNINTVYKWKTLSFISKRQKYYISNNSWYIKYNFQEKLVSTTASNNSPLWCLITSAYQERCKFLENKQYIKNPQFRKQIKKHT